MGAGGVKEVEKGGGNGAGEGWTRGGGEGAGRARTYHRVPRTRDVRLTAAPPLHEGKPESLKQQVPSASPP